MCRWCDVISGSSAPISLNWNLFSQNQQEIASTGKQIIVGRRPEVLSQSLPSFRYRLSVLSVVYQKSLNVSEKNCNVNQSKVWIELTPIFKLMCAIYSTAVPLRKATQRSCRQNIPETIKCAKCEMQNWWYWPVRREDRFHWWVVASPSSCRWSCWVLSCCLSTRRHKLTTADSRECSESHWVQNELLMTCTVF